MPDYTDVPISSFPDAQSVDASDKVTGLKSGNNTNFSFNSILAWLIIQFYAVFLPVSSKGAAGGVASLDSTGIVPDDQLPPIPSQPSDIGAQDEITASGILKGDGQGGVSAATAGTDYQAPLTAGTDYQTPLTAGTDYVTPAQLEGKANQAQLATVESGSTASRAYAVGEYFCWNGLLYRVTAAISSGGAFTPGTNCEQSTVGDTLFGQFRRDTLYNPGTTVSVATDTTLTLSEDYRHYKFVQMVLYNAASATNTTRTILTIPTNDLESRVHYPLAFGSTVGSVSIGVGSTVGTTIRFYASAISPLTLRYIFGLA